MDYKYTIYFTYDGKRRECQLMISIDFSTIPVDEEMIRDDIEVFIKRWHYYKEGEIVTDVLLCDEGGNPICTIPPFEAIISR